MKNTYFLNKPIYPFHRVELKLTSTTTIKLFSLDNMMPIHYKILLSFLIVLLLNVLLYKVSLQFKYTILNRVLHSFLNNFIAKYNLVTYI